MDAGDKYEKDSRKDSEGGFGKCRVLPIEKQDPPQRNQVLAQGQALVIPPHIADGEIRSTFL